MYGRLFLLVLLLWGMARADYRHVRELRLKKDEVEKVMIIKEGSERLLTFRWTLYHNGGLVIHRSFDGFNSQNVLRLNHTNQSIRIEVDMSGRSPKAFSFIVIKFKAFDFERREAVFDLMLRDDDEKVLLEYLDAPGA